MWLTLAILGYFFNSLSIFLDKYLLGGSLPSPKIYAFYAGIFSLLILLIIPIGVLVSYGFLTPLEKIFPESLEIFLIPQFPLIVLTFFPGIIFILALLFYYQGIKDFEISRIGPAVGGIVPLFTLILISLFSFFPLNLGFEKQIIVFKEYLALLFLVLGTMILVFQKEKLATFKILKLSITASFLFSLSFVLSKIVYNFLPFWPAFIWMRMGDFIGAISLLIFSEVRHGIFFQKEISKEKIALPFIFAKGAGGLGSVLQNGAIFLAPIVFLPIINALAGVQYIFLMILAILFFFKFPKILKEEISKRVLFQKIISILLILIGLYFLSL